MCRRPISGNQTLLPCIWWAASSFNWQNGSCLGNCDAFFQFWKWLYFCQKAMEFVNIFLVICIISHCPFKSGANLVNANLKKQPRCWLQWWLSHCRLFQISKLNLNLNSNAKLASRVKDLGKSSFYLKKREFCEKIHKPGGRVCRISQKLIFFFKKWKINGKINQKQNKTSQNPYRAGWSAFFHNILFLL